MTNNNHSMTPPPELVAQIRRGALHGSEGQLDYELRLIHDAYRAGADMELVMCMNYVDHNVSGNRARALREHRRPKPPSLKEQALCHLESFAGSIETLGMDSDLIRRAIEALPD